MKKTLTLFSLLMICLLTIAQNPCPQVIPAIQVMAERMWKGDNQQEVPFSEFEALCKTMPEAPGVNLLGKIDGDWQFHQWL